MRAHNIVHCTHWQLWQSAQHRCASSAKSHSQQYVQSCRGANHISPIMHTLVLDWVYRIGSNISYLSGVAVWVVNTIQSLERNLRVVAPNASDKVVIFNRFSPVRREWLWGSIFFNLRKLLEDVHHVLSSAHKETSNTYIKTARFFDPRAEMRHFNTSFKDSIRSQNR